MPKQVAPSQSVSLSPRRRLPILLRHAWYGLNQAFRRRIAHLEITPDQFTVMRTLTEAGETGLSQRQLTEEMGSDPNTIASLVLRMEKAGLLERKTHREDRRANVLKLLPAAEKKYEAAREAALALQSEVLSSFSEADRARFLEMLETLSNAARSAADKR
jgi:DNA-binding MarR family transcriptional regulator